MQDIVIYAAANETLGIVRDYANARNQAAPVLVLGVSVCLRIRLFTTCEVATPYPVSAFSSIVDWQWNMDADFDRSTSCKLTADADSISVHTVTDTVNGETLDFTEFVIPISNMNTQELAAWLGSEKKRTGLNGELVGYDNGGNAVFVLQIENFTVRNRVAGLGDPTALDQGIVTRPIAETMIQSAVSSSASTKQDKLTAANAGTGISIDSAGTISTAAVPQSAITGLSVALASKQDNLTAGYRMAIVSGSTVDQSRWLPIESPTGSTVTMMAGHAYNLNATTSSKTLNAETAPADSFGLEGHLEIFVAGTGFVKTGANVVLSQPLEPDSINYCTVRFRRGMAIISVEDHIGGYIVVSASGTSSGTLPYGLASAGSQYIAFNDTLAGQTIDMGGVITNGEKHVVGNGYTDTILTGGVSCTSKTTFANLSMQNVSALGGTMTLSDIYISSGSTVSVSGGQLAVEKVSGNGGVIDLGQTRVSATSPVVMSGVTVANGHAYGEDVYLKNGGGLLVHGTSAFISSCLFSSNHADRNGGAISTETGGYVTVTDCVFEDNTADFGRTAIHLATPGSGYTAVLNISNCVFKSGQNIYTGGTTTLEGSNSLLGTVAGVGSAIIASGAIVDLTGNTNTKAVATNNGVTFAPGGATVYPSAGSASAYYLGGVTIPQIGNTNVVNLGGSANVVVPVNGVTNISGCTFSGGSASYLGGAILVSSGALFSANGCTFSGNYSNQGGAIGGMYATIKLSSCEIVGNTAGTYGALVCSGGSAEIIDCNISGNTVGQSYNGVIYARLGASVTLSGCTADHLIHLGDSASVVTFGGSNSVSGVDGSGSVTISGGAIVDLTGNTNAAPINPGGGIVIPARPESASVQIRYTDPDAPLQSGFSLREFNELEIRGTTISNRGVIYGATVTVPADTQDTWLIGTTGGTVELTSANAGDYVVSGGLTGVEKS